MIPCGQGRPDFTTGILNKAFCEAIRRSVLMAKAKPPPRQ